ncbi:MAG: hypothetical protein EOO69_10925 [Moraxellaceae bacterium]|nr:MAG: hypothetical protein EOO69_10925 [Moraxellaceae bacterium]
MVEKNMLWIALFSTIGFVQGLSIKVILFQIPHFSERLFFKITKSKVLSLLLFMLLTIFLTAFFYSAIIYFSRYFSSDLWIKIYQSWMYSFFAGIILLAFMVKD